MVDFAKIAATSEAAGFQYYDVQSFSFNIPSYSIPHFTGSDNSHTLQFTLPKNRLGKALTSQILTNILMNLSNVDAAGVYRLATSGDNGSKTIGSSGGFPIFYNWGISISSDATNLIFTVVIANGSAVNDVVTEAFTISGKVFFYLAPF